MTGRHVIHTGVYDPMNGGSGDLSLNFSLWPEHMNTLGYEVGDETITFAGVVWDEGLGSMPVVLGQGLFLPLHVTLALFIRVSSLRFAAV